MRKRISESNIFPHFNLFNEYQKIEKLISENQIIGAINQWGRRLPPKLTIEEYVNHLCFSNWVLRGTFLSIEEMRRELGIEKKKLYVKTISQDMVLDFLQYAANLCFQASSTIERSTTTYVLDKHYFSMVAENLTRLVNHLGAEFIKEDGSPEIFVAYKDELSTVVANDYPDIKDSIVEYKKIDNRADLKRKGEILCTLFKKLESFEKKFKGTTYASLCNDTTFLFNKTGIRHWVDADNIASKTFLTMQPKELEMWYDRTFNMFLSCMVISQYLDVKKEIENIRRTE